MPDDINHNLNPAESRREGRAKACDGLLTSQFGRRASQAGAKALARLRSTPEASVNPVQVHERIAENDGPLEPGRDQGELILSSASGRNRVIAAVAGQGLRERNDRDLTRPRGDRYRLGAWLAFAACLAGLAGGLIYFMGARGGLEEPILAVKGPGIVVVRGHKTIAAASGMHLRLGDIVQTPKGATASIHYRQDGARVEVFHLTELKLGDRRATNQLELRRGKIEMTLVASSTRPAWVCATPQAKAKVIGTHFILAAKTAATWLAVLSGEVEMTKVEDQASTRVGARHYTVAAAGLELVARSETERWQTPYCILRPAPKTS